MIFPRYVAFFFVTMCIVLGCNRPPRQIDRKILTHSQGAVTIDCDVWADNWFALYLGEGLLIEDSESIRQERSFNSESFTFRADYPIVLNLVAKDFKEDDSGLEYIGTPKQQLGDGGLIAQFRDATTGRLIVATNTNWKCFVLHRGPLDESCALEKSPQAGVGSCAFEVFPEPDAWKAADFVTEGWKSATEFSEGEVRPKGGFDQIEWDKEAKLIWSEDLKKDNTILFRIVIDGPPSDMANR